MYPFSDRDESHTFATPRKIQKDWASDHTSHPSRLDPYDSPSNLKDVLCSPRGSLVTSFPLRAAIGPTPQRDGKALGLFDLLSPSGLSTPSTRRNPPRSSGNGTPLRSRRLKTPSKGQDSAHCSAHSLTPVSSTKKFYLSNFFATPTTMRYATIVEADEGEVEAGVGTFNQPDFLSKKAGAEPETPSFLRRTNVLFPRPTVRKEQESYGYSPMAVRMPRGVVGKGLSQLVQGLRDMEEEVIEEMMEDDMAALREVETAESADQASRVSLDHAVKDADRITTPSKAQMQWKKKGQKRTTRLVYLRPLRGKPQNTAETAIPEESSEDEAAADSREQDIPPAGVHDDNDAGLKSNPPRKDEGQSGSRLVRKVRKIKATAHANYRALKIRSKNSKGKGRFSRRR